jgi:hypothetical protein
MTYGRVQTRPLPGGSNQTASQLLPFLRGSRLARTVIHLASPKNLGIIRDPRACKFIILEGELQP